jgi:hypothetical protein
MRVDNKTKWDSKHIEAFVRRVAVEEYEPARLKLMKIEVRTGKRSRVSQDMYPGYVSGYAYYNRNFMRLNVPVDTIDRIDLCHVIAHEFAHCRGLKHGAAMNSSRYRRIGNWRERYAWAETVPLERKAEPKKMKPDDNLKLSHALSKAAEWERKVKAATTHLKRWQRKVKYYDTKMKKAAASSPEVSK